MFKEILDYLFDETQDAKVFGETTNTCFYVPQDKDLQDGEPGAHRAYADLLEYGGSIVAHKRNGRTLFEHCQVVNPDKLCNYQMVADPTPFDEEYVNHFFSPKLEKLTVFREFYKSGVKENIPVIVGARIFGRFMEMPAIRVGDNWQHVGTGEPIPTKSVLYYTQNIVDNE